MQAILVGGAVTIFGFGMGFGASLTNGGTGALSVMQIALGIIVVGVVGMAVSAVHSGNQKVQIR